MAAFLGLIYSVHCQSYGARLARIVRCMPWPMISQCANSSRWGGSCKSSVRSLRVATMPIESSRQEDRYWFILGGDLEAYRHYRRRNEVVILPRTGFIEVARANGVPIIPVVVQGAHRSAYIFTEGKAIAQFLRLRHWARLERFPIALALPWGIALGPWLPYLPLPFPIRLRILPPIHIAADTDAMEAGRHIQMLMQQALNEMAAL